MTSVFGYNEGRPLHRSPSGRRWASLDEGRASRAVSGVRAGAVPLPAVASSRDTWAGMLVVEQLGHQLADVGSLGAAAADVPAALWERALYEPLRDFLARPGKRFRARLVEACYRIAGGSGSPAPLVLQIVEMLHAGSLIVDDIEDGSETRRGEPSLHARYGLPLALNAGNWLYFWPQVLLQRLGLSPQAELLARRAISTTLFAAHHGQALDLAVKVHELAPSEIARVVQATSELKTGRLMALAAELGAMVAGASPGTRRALRAFGVELGCVLQALDDTSGLCSPRLRAKGIEDVSLGKATWVWASAAHSLPSQRMGQLLHQAQLVSRGEMPAERLAESLVAPAKVASDAVPVRLERAFGALRAAIGSPPELESLTEEIERLERGYD